MAVGSDDIRAEYGRLLASWRRRGRGRGFGFPAGAGAGAGLWLPGGGGGGGGCMGVQWRVADVRAAPAVCRGQRDSRGG